MNDMHSCSYFCDRPACIKAQRDELRAALAAQPAEPAGDVVVSCNEDGQIVAVTRQDDEGRILSVIAEAQPAPSHRAPSHRLSDARMDGIYNAWRDMGDDVSYGDLMRMVEAEIQGGK